MTTPSASGTIVPLLTSRQAATVLGVAADTIERWRRQGRGPRFVRVAGRAVRYRPDDLNDYVTTHTAGGGA